MDYKEQVEEVLSTAKFGDLIEFSYPIGYSHWGVYDEDGFVIHFAVAEEGKLMNKVRTSLQSWFPVCGDLLLGGTKIRRMPLGEVTVPEGAHVFIANNGHAFRATAPEDMRKRRDALIDKELGYKLTSLNCEHFATFIRYGKAVCNQIPAKSKNVECEEATTTFQEIVDSKESGENADSKTAPGIVNSKKSQGIVNSEEKEEVPHYP
ncbi:phospholipase A and acyltransferase 2-like [Notolabrus celidotus]|uniref:phospholipase A and acyltransferase 2-like n=1 Tax=Notolabrus celidotus TaxID=1203425 RepID=UPI00148F77FB|nr:phospholipase A and acyltransferase 2-like [Notolabrus celidotus]